MKETMSIKLNVNGRDYILDLSPADPLSGVLREKLGLLGTKVGCGSGECGACTVLIDGKSAKSCITPVVAVQDCEILTIEGLSDEVHPLHPIQQSFVDAGAIQCGFCTPGFVMATYSLLKSNPHPDDEEIKAGLAGNLCRCTGYETILAAVHLAAERMAAAGGI